MATVNNTVPTLLDWARRQDPNGSIANIVETLQTQNVFLQDMPMVEGNLPTGHRITSRNVLPSVQWRKLNEGITPGKSGTTQVDESFGMLEGKSSVDIDLARLNGNEAAFRASEDKGFVQALNKEVETGIAYHSTLTAPEKFHGLIPRLDSTTGAFGAQVIKADATAAGNDQASILLVGWAPDKVFGIFPKGLPVGIETIDMGKQYVDDGTGKTYLAWVTHWKWKIGVAVRDGRYLVRICNIDVSAFAPGNDTIVNAMIDAYHQLQSVNDCSPVFYVNRKVATFLHKEAKTATKNATLSLDQIAGKPMASVLGVPVRVTDALTNTEAVVS
jgi:hypothetical protein